VLRIRSKIMLACALVMLCGWSALTSHAQQQFRTMTPDLHLYDMGSKFLPKDSRVFVWVPPNYDSEPAKRYPVLYMHDGASVFFTWRIDEIAKPLIISRQIEPLIIVMVTNGGTQDDRFDEYTPTRSAGFNHGGKADSYGRFLIEELKPFIDSEYRTLTDAANTGLGGVSLGGLVSLYLGLKYPAVFGRLAVMSPSVWWDNKLIVSQVKKLDSRPGMRIWLDIGTGEGQGSIGDVKELRDALVKKGWKLDSDLMYYEAKGAEHNEEAFARRAGVMLTYLFAPQAGTK
jgi:predicted alpha/beta superfamily hydrolase